MRQHQGRHRQELTDDTVEFQPRTSRVARFFSSHRVRVACAAVLGVLVLSGSVAWASDWDRRHRHHNYPNSAPSLPRPTVSGTLKPTPTPTPTPTTQASTTTKPPTPTPSVVTTSTTTQPPAPPPTTPAATPSGGQQLKAYLTGYSYYDNTPPGSADISNPIIHQKAGGTGTYADPITVAVGHSLATGHDVLDWAEGTRFYIPSMKRYLIVEDTCGDGPTPQNRGCHKLNSEAIDGGASTWLDVWVDGKTAGEDASNECMSDITKVIMVIVNPPAGLSVTAGSISSSAGCAG